MKTDPESVNLLMDASAYPWSMNAVRHAALESGSIPAGLLYQSRHQAQCWLDVHRRFAPSNPDGGVLDIYLQIFEYIGIHLEKTPYSVLSLGCGGGEKERAFLLHSGTAPRLMQLVDGSSSLALESLKTIGFPGHSQAIVADLDQLHRPPHWADFSTIPSGSKRVVFFLGMLPNMDVHKAWRLLHLWTRPGDWVVLSANMACREEFNNHLPTILPQYDNPPTRRWLTAFLEDAGIRNASSDLTYSVHDIDLPGPELKQIEVTYTPRQEVLFPGMDPSPLRWNPGQPIRLFQSIRYGLLAVDYWAAQYDFEMLAQAIQPNVEEGVYLLERRSPRPDSPG